MTGSDAPISEPVDARGWRFPPSRVWLRPPAARSLVWPLLVCVAAALVQMWPMWRRGIVQHGEIWVSTSCVAEAKYALAEGQFPIRVMPKQDFGTRYPLFQFYGNLPFTVAGLIHSLPGVGPYAAMKVTIFIALVAGGFFACRLARRITRNPSASIWAGPVFLLAPYLFTDLHARGAVTETVGLCLLPVVMFYTTRAFASRRRRFVPLAALAWTALALTHNITYLYGVIFVGLYVLFGLHLRRRGEFRRLGRLAVAGAMHGLLVLWYFVPQMYVLDDLSLSRTLASPTHYAYLAELRHLLSPRMVSHSASTTQRLGLQVGWPILAAAIVCAFLILWPWTGRRIRGAIVQLLVPFALALFMAWSPDLGLRRESGAPVNFWEYLPRTLHYVQFPYRLLVFVMLFGSLLAACALAGLFRRRRGGRVPLPVAAAAALLLAGSCASYLHRLPVHGRREERILVGRPDVGGAKYDYLMSTRATSLTGIAPPDAELTAWEFGLLENGQFQPVLPLLPVPPGVEAVRVEGSVARGRARPEDQPPVRVNVRVGESAASKDLPAAGDFEMVVPVPDAASGQRAVAVEIRPEPPREPAVTIRRIRWVMKPDAAPPALPFVPASQVRPSVKYNATTTASVTLDRPSLVQLPVLYYPRLLRVTDGGKSIGYGNVARFVAVELPAGDHQLAVRFVGVRWANVASCAGVGLVALLWLPLPRTRGRGRG